MCGLQCQADSHNIARSPPTQSQTTHEQVVLHMPVSVTTLHIYVVHTLDYTTPHRFCHTVTMQLCNYGRICPFPHYWSNYSYHCIYQLEGGFWAYVSVSSISYHSNTHMHSLSKQLSHVHTCKYHTHTHTHTDQFTLSIFRYQR